jgi:sortase (surface protein transpeptidase)
MTTRQERLAVRGRRLETVAAAVTVLVAVALCGADTEPENDNRRAGGELTRVAKDASRPQAVDTRPPLPEPEEVGRSEPTRLSIPQIDTDVEVFAADAEEAGIPPAPDEDNIQRAVWYRGGPSPGEQGPALILGHLDTQDGPAAFARIGRLRPGAEVYIEREDGDTVVFTVDSVEQYPRKDFPSDRVYGATRTPQLRLITCGGNWTEKDGYDANIIAFASLQEDRS